MYRRIRFLALLLLLLLGISLPLKAALTRITLSQALADDLVRISEATGNGSYNEKGLRVRIENRSRQPLLLTIDPALIFRPEDTSYQDLVVAGNEKLVLQAGKYNTIELQTYCGKSQARGPSASTNFRLLKQGDSTLIRVLQFIRTRGIHNTIAQHAVWVLTDDHDLGSVYGPEQDMASRQLIVYIAGLLGKNLPAYYRQYDINTTPGAPVFRPKTLRIFARFQWSLEIPQQLTLAVFDEQGNAVEKLFDRQDYKKGHYELTAKFESAGVAAGRYYIRLLSGDRLLQETTVNVE